MNNVNVNDIPDLKRNEQIKEKYSYQDYIKNKTQGGGSNIGGGQPQSQISNQKIETNMNTNKFSYENYIKSKTSQQGDQNLRSSENQQNINDFYSPSFSNMQNTYSKQENINQGPSLSSSKIQNFPPSGNDFNLLNFSQMPKPDPMQKSTIIPQDDFGFKQEQQVDNPYSMLSFNEFNPQKNYSMMTGTSNRSQIPINYDNQPRIGGSMNVHMGGNFPSSNYNMPGQFPQGGFPTFQDVNNREGNIGGNKGSSNLEFPR